MTNTHVLPLLLLAACTHATAAPAVTSTPGSVVFFEIASANVQRAATFYQELFGWKPVAPIAPDGAIYAGGMINGVPGHPGGASTVVYIGVDHVQQSYSRALALGATSVIAPRPIPNKGSFAVVLDLDKNRLGLFSTETAP
jgi:predicted enzyme related to lactoylglutathione lyase